MEPHVYLKRGKKNILLVRYFGKLHFITLDHRLTYKVRPWFLERPRTEEEMDEKALTRASIDLKEIRGVAAGGTGRGQVVQFYLKEGKRRYELAEDTDEPTFSALFHGLESFTPPQQNSNWQDVRLAKQEPRLRNILWSIGAAVNAVGFVAASLVFAGGFRVPWFSGLCLLCILASLVLYCLFPAYFTTYEGKRGYRQKRSAMMLYALVFAPFGLLAGALIHSCIFDWLKACLIGAVAVIGLTVLLWKLVPDFRDAGKVIPFLLLGVLVSAGPVLAVNELLDTAPASKLRTEVVDTNYVNSRGGDSYYLVVKLEDRESRISVSEELFESIRVGDTIVVDIHQGALGIPYAEMAD